MTVRVGGGPPSAPRLARSRPVLLLAVDVGADRVGETVGALDDLGLPHRTVVPEGLTVALLELDPVLVIVQCDRRSARALDLVRRLHAEERSVLVLVTGLREEDEPVLLDAGALAAVAVPASARRLRSRVRSLHRHLVGQLEDGVQTYRFDGVQIDPARWQVEVHGRAVHLTKTEFELLLLLARRRGQVVSRAELTGVGEDRPVGDFALESHISRLRSKIQAAGGPRLVEAVRGVGYRLRA